MAKGYTDVDTVAAYLGRTLTTPQGMEASTLIDAAEAYIDRETRRQWLVAPITGERYDLLTPVIYLEQAPVASVQSITTRTTQVGAPLNTLVAGTDYELIDATLGQVQLADGYQSRHGDVIALVSYTPNRPVPADISFAACLIVAESLKMTLFPDRWGLEDAQVDQNRKLTYTDGGMTLHIPQTAQDIIDGYQRTIFA